MLVLILKSQYFKDRSRSAVRLQWFIPLRLINGQLTPPLSPPSALR